MPKGKESKKEKVVRTQVQVEEPSTKKKRELSQSLSLKVGNTSFTVPIDCIKRFPNTTLGALLESFDDNTSPSDLEFPDRSPAVFEKIVVPFYTDNGSLGNKPFILCLQVLENLQVYKILEIQGELDFWGIPTSARNLSISIKDLQAATKEKEQQKEKSKKSKRGKFTKIENVISNQQS